MMSVVHTCRIFSLCMYMQYNGVVMIFKNQLTSLRNETSNQEQCLSALVQKKKMKKDMQIYTGWNTLLIRKACGYACREYEVIYLPRFPSFNSTHHLDYHYRNHMQNMDHATKCLI